MYVVAHVIYVYVVALSLCTCKLWLMLFTCRFLCCDSCLFVRVCCGLCLLLYMYVVTRVSLYVYVVAHVIYVYVVACVCCSTCMLWLVSAVHTRSHNATEQCERQ